jgi:hypothetical protein
MHRHKIVAQILLILSILNFVLAAPIVRVREIPGARGAVAVRVPAEGVVAVLEKRPWAPQPGTSGGPGPEQPEPQSTTSPEHPETEKVYHDASPGPPGPPETEEVYHDASSEELKPPETSSKAAWKQKIFTPEKIKAIKYVGIAGILTTAYLGLLLPTISNNDGQDR